jgi:hypothetical protein
MRFARDSRKISGAEQRLAESVFHDSLPDWKRINITDALGPVPGVDRPYTDESMREFWVNVGPDYYPNLDRATDYGYSSARNLLIHELTHVWQYYHGYWVVLRSLWANQWGKGYSYTIEESDAWNDFNVEQQAQIVEDWFKRGKSETDSRFVFIEKIIRPGVTGGFWADIFDETLIRMPLEDLRTFSP